MASVFSMTGYATIQSAIASGQLTVELRSVNSRFLDLTLRIPDDLHSLESAIRETIGSRVKRGKMECRLSLKSETLGATSRLSPSALTTLASLQGEALKAFPEARALSVSEILSYPGVLTSDSVDAEQVSKDVLDALNRAGCLPRLPRTRRRGSCQSASGVLRQHRGNRPRYRVPTP